jgi:hypothetical protein
LEAFLIYIAKKELDSTNQNPRSEVGGGAAPPTSLLGFCVASNARITALCLRSNPKGGAKRLLLGFVQEQLTRLTIIEI